MPTVKASREQVNDSQNAGKFNLGQHIKSSFNFFLLGMQSVPCCPKIVKDHMVCIYLHVYKINPCAVTTGTHNNQ